VSGGGRSPLRRIHDAVYEQEPRARRSLEFHRSRPTDDIVESLRPSPDNDEPLRVKPDGRVFQGNTRIKVLEERGYPVNDLPRDIVQ
jgi:hypothetical protein